MWIKNYDVRHLPGHWPNDCCYIYQIGSLLDNLIVKHLFLVCKQLHKVLWGRGMRIINYHNPLFKVFSQKTRSWLCFRPVTTTKIEKYRILNHPECYCWALHTNFENPMLQTRDTRKTKIYPKIFMLTLWYILHWSVHAHYHPICKRPGGNKHHTSVA